MMTNSFIHEKKCGKNIRSCIYQEVFAARVCVANCVLGFSGQNRHRWPGQ